MSDKWGVGNKKDAKPFGKSKFRDGEEFDLISGEHPHSRRDDSVYARTKDGAIYGFDGHSILVKIELETYNYLKSSYLSGDEVRKAGCGKIYLNDKLCYGFGFRDALAGLLIAHRKLQALFDLSVQLWRENHDGLIGRKVYYRNEPGTITAFYPDQGAVIIEFENGQKRPLMPYEIEDTKRGETVEEPENDVKDDILSSDIWWHRE